MGWAVAGARHLSRIAKGKRPAIRLGEMVEGAETRSELYRSLKLFDEE